uniref:Uncharacterized protein n=1 Tax=Hyaloperonospora arabidopsidis (strain Emoy2) TaxID=559515 RepID=M4B6G8_HYAAE
MKAKSPLLGSEHHAPRTKKPTLALKPPPEQPWLTKPLREFNNPWVNRQRIPAPKRINTGRFSVLSGIDIPNVTESNRCMILYV